MMAIGQQDSGIVIIIIITTTNLYYILSCNCWHTTTNVQNHKYEGDSNEIFNYIHLFSMYILHNYEIYYEYASHMIIHWNAWQREQNQLGKHCNEDKIWISLYNTAKDINELQKTLRTVSRHTKT